MLTVCKILKNWFKNVIKFNLGQDIVQFSYSQNMCTKYKKQKPTTIEYDYMNFSTDFKGKEEVVQFDLLGYLNITFNFNGYGDSITHCDQKWNNLIWYDQSNLGHYLFN